MWIVGESEDPAELLGSMLMSLYGIIAGGFHLEGEKDVEFTVRGSSPEEALVRFLSECLYLVEGEGVVITDPLIAVEDDLLSISLSSKGQLFTIDPGHAGMEVKAITYHEVGIVKEGLMYKARVLVDL